MEQMFINKVAVLSTLWKKTEFCGFTVKKSQLCGYSGKCGIPHFLFDDNHFTFLKGMKRTQTQLKKI